MAGEMEIGRAVTTRGSRDGTGNGRRCDGEKAQSLRFVHVSLPLGDAAYGSLAGLYDLGCALAVLPYARS